MTKACWTGTLTVPSWFCKRFYGTPRQEHKRLAKERDAVETIIVEAQRENGGGGIEGSFQGFVFMF